MENLILIKGKLRNTNYFLILLKDKIKYSSNNNYIKYNNSNIIYINGLYPPVFIEEELFNNLDLNRNIQCFLTSEEVDINSLDYKQLINNEDIIGLISYLLTYKSIHNFPKDVTIEFIISLLNVCLFSL